MSTKSLAYLQGEGGHGEALLFRRYLYVSFLSLCKKKMSPMFLWSSAPKLTAEDSNSRF